MNRRTFLAATAGAAAAGWLAGAALGTVSRRPDAPVPDDSVCSSAGVAARRVAVAASPGVLTFAGTRLFKEGFLDELAEQYTRQSGRATRIVGGGCADGIGAVSTGEAHLGGLCCAVDGSPAKDWPYLQVGVDLKVIVAHPSVEVTGVTLTQLREIVLGRLRNWRGLGGRDEAIALVVHDHCPDYMEPVRRALLDDGREWSRHALVAKTDQKHLDIVARFPSTLGVNSWILAAPYVRAGKLKTLALDGLQPEAQPARKSRYGLVGPLNMVFRQWRPELMKGFFDFLYGPAGQRLIAKHAVPVGASAAGYPAKVRASEPAGVRV